MSRVDGPPKPVMERSQSGLDGSRVVRVVTLASASGRYGGPYDTARYQAAVLERAGMTCTIAAGHTENDAPTGKTLASASHHLGRVRDGAGRFGPVFLFSLPLARVLI